MLRLRVGPSKMRLMTHLVVMCLSMISGCVGPAIERGRGSVSLGIERRTGHGIEPASHAIDDAGSSGVTMADGISEDEAVALALWNNAAFQESLADLGVTYADLVQAGLLTNPTFSILFPLGPKQLEFTALFPIEALWLRPRRIAMAETESERLAERLVQNGLDLTRDVRVAYAEVIRSGKRAAFTEQATLLHAHIAELAEARQRAGDASALEISAARIDAQRAKEDAVRQAAELMLAKERLQSLLGRTVSEGHWEFNEEPALAQNEFDVQLLIHEAYSARPDLRAAELAIDSACQRAGLARLEFIKLAGLADANGAGDKGFEAGPGLQVELPIFHRNEAGIARAEAEIERAVLRLKTVQHRISLEVMEAHTQFVQAREQHEIWQSQILPPSEEAVRQAERAFEGGESPLLLVLETTRRLLEARARSIDAEANLRRAWAELERSVGRRLNRQQNEAESQEPTQ